MSFLQLRSSLSKFFLLGFPTVTTQAASSITSSQATGNGTVVNNGGSATTSRGFCWATTAQPTTASSTVTSGSGTGAYTGTLSSLSSSTLYHYRAYATNAIGTGYGDDVTFTTSAGGGGSPPKATGFMRTITRFWGF